MDKHTFLIDAGDVAVHVVSKDFAVATRVARGVAYMLDAGQPMPVESDAEELREQLREARIEIVRLRAHVSVLEDEDTRAAFMRTGGFSDDDAAMSFSQVGAARDQQVSVEAFHHEDVANKVLQVVRDLAKSGTVVLREERFEFVESGRRFRFRLNVNQITADTIVEDGETAPAAPSSLVKALDTLEALRARYGHAALIAAIQVARERVLCKGEAPKVL